MGYLLRLADGGGEIVTRTQDWDEKPSAYVGALPAQTQHSNQSTPAPTCVKILEVYYSFACNLHGCDKLANIFHHQITLQGSDNTQLFLALES